MKLTRHGEIIQLASMPHFFPVNCYLVEEADSLTLVDAALPFSWKGIESAVRSSGKPLRRILLTHPHYDHVGSVDRLRALHPDVEFLMPKRDAKWAGGDFTMEPGEPSQPIRGGAPKPSQLQAKPDRLVEDGDRVGSLRAIATPGHTPGHLAYLDERSGSLLAGDAFQTRGGVAVAGKVVPWFPFPAFGTWSAETALVSARRVAGLGVTLLAPGHGAMLPDPQAAIAKAIEEAERALAKR